MTKLTKINPDTLAPPMENLFANIVVTPPGARLAFIAGQVAIDRQGNVIGVGNHAEQAVQCFKNIRDALAAIDAKPDQVTQMTIIVVNYEDALLEVINKAGADVFGDEWPVTATTLIGAAALGNSVFLVEVNAIVAV